MKAKAGGKKKQSGHGAGRGPQGPGAVRASSKPPPPKRAPKTSAARNASRRLARDDFRFVWRPFTQMREWRASDPVVIEKAKGCWLYDTEGRKYLDGVSSLWVNVHGHGRKEINDAIVRQTRRLAHSTLLGLAHPPSIELARRLVRIAPKGLTKVFYSDNGSTAVEIALKMAFQFWRQQGGAAKRKTEFVKLDLAYHGDTLGAVSVGGVNLFHSVYKNLTFKTHTAQAPYCYRCPLGLERASCQIDCLQSLERILTERAGRTAAVIVEPLMQCAGGFIKAPEGFLRRVRDLCDRHDAFLIADEVAVGFGRTGRMFACEHENTSPDFLCLAKGLTGGTLPLAATLTSERIYEGFLGRHEEFKTFFHGHTYTGNPIACAAAIANLDLFRSNRTLQKLQPRIRQFERRLSRLPACPLVGDVRSLGLLAGVEMVQSREEKKSFAPEVQIGARVCREARERGVLLRPLGPVLVLMPPLTVSKEELDFLFDAVEGALEETARWAAREGIWSR